MDGEVDVDAFRGSGSEHAIPERELAAQRAAMHATHTAKLHRAVARTRRWRVEIARVGFVDQLEERRHTPPARDLFECDLSFSVDHNAQQPVTHLAAFDDDRLFRPTTTHFTGADRV